ncbi:TPA: hypothetical protein ACUJUE_001520 [Streptococcus agalactiae]
MIKILAACGAGINSSHQIKDAIETQLGDRGYNVPIPVVEAGSILYRIPVMSEPVFTALEQVIKEHNLS